MNYSVIASTLHVEKLLKKRQDNDYIHGISTNEFNKYRDDVLQKAKENHDYSHEPHIVGSTYLKQCDPDKTHVLANGTTYALKERCFGFTKGYLQVGENEFIRVVTIIPIFWITFAFLLSAMCFYLFIGYTAGKTPGIDLPIDGTDSGETVPNQNSHIAAGEEFTEITVFPEVIVDDTTPNVPLYNSDKNTVYFVYNLYEGDTLLHKTGLIPPGYKVQWNAKESLSIGEHEIRMVIECYDLETKTPCNGSTTQCTIIVD